MYTVKGWCAGIIIFEKKIEERELPDFMSSAKEQLLGGELKLQFASEVQTATEVCVDVFEDYPRRYCSDLSKAFKK